MSFDQLRKIVVIKNIPSDYIEEAIFILRTKGKAENILTKDGNIVSGNTKAESDYLIKEAQKIINNYIKEYDKEYNHKGEKNESINNKQKKTPTTKTSIRWRLNLNSIIYITIISSIAAFIYLIIRIVTY